MISTDIGLCPTAREDGRITRNHVSSHLVFGAGGTAWAATGEESLAYGMEALCMHGSCSSFSFHSMPGSIWEPVLETRRSCQYCAHKRNICVRLNNSTQNWHPRRCTKLRSRRILRGTFVEAANMNQTLTVGELRLAHKRGDIVSGCFETAQKKTGLRDSASYGDA